MTSRVVGGERVGGVVIWPYNPTRVCGAMHGYHGQLVSSLTKGVSRVCQGCVKGVSRVCHGCHWYVKGVSWVYYGCVKGVSWVCQGCHWYVKGVSWVYYGCIKGVSRMCQRCVNGVYQGCVMGVNGVSREHLGCQGCVTGVSKVTSRVCNTIRVSGTMHGCHCQLVSSVRIRH